jgi:hypothetical protein
MDDKKKKIYIGIIVFCLLASAGVLYWSSSSSTQIPVGVTEPDTFVGGGAPMGAAPASSLGNVPQLTKDIDYGVPSVFPNNAKFDASVFDTSHFKVLTDYTILTVSPEEIGRENPYNTY